MRKKIIIVLMLVFMASMAHAADWGLSNYHLFTKTINEKLDLEFEVTDSFKDDMSDFYIGYAQLSFDWKKYKWLAYGLGYRGHWLEKAGGWTFESRPMINVKLKRFHKGWFLLNRTRWEYRDYQTSQNEEWRLRNLSILTSPWKWTKWNLTPFLHEEVFYSLEKGEADMNWLVPGLQYKIAADVTLKLGYRWQTEKRNGKWEGKNVLVSTLLWKF